MSEAISSTISDVSEDALLPHDEVPNLLIELNERKLAKLASAYSTVGTTDGPVPGAAIEAIKEAAVIVGEDQAFYLHTQYVLALFLSMWC